MTVNLKNFSAILQHIGINILNIVIIDDEIDANTVNCFSSSNDYKIKCIEINQENFVRFLNKENVDFINYNKDSIYIIRNGNFLKIKNLFALISNSEVNMGRGGSQKSHMLSPLDFRLSSYVMAMFNFDYKLISSLNTFNYINKDRYLS